MRFLRYYILASYDVRESKLREEDIYDWLTKSNAQTNHVADPLGFVAKLKNATGDYAGFTKGLAPRGTEEHGILNTRAVGGSAIKQHFVLLLAGRHLSPQLFTRLCDGTEQLMCLWLFAGVPAKEYERAIVSAAKELRAVGPEQFDAWAAAFFDVQKSEHAQRFKTALQNLRTSDVRQFRLKYFLAKMAQHFDVEAYRLEGHESLSGYLATNNEVEHIQAVAANSDAVIEFGEGAQDPTLIQRLGNLMLLEKSVNIVAGAEPYSRNARFTPPRNS